MNETILLESARQEQPYSPAPPPEFEPALHAGQPPTVFVRKFLFLLCVLLGLLTLTGLVIASLFTGLGEFVPNHGLLPKHTLDAPASAIAIETDAKGHGTRINVVDDEMLHSGEPVKDLVYWTHIPLDTIRDRLPAARVVGLSADDSKLLFVCEQMVRRGMTVAGLNPDQERMTPWNRPITDVTYFPGVDDRNGVCVVPDRKSGLRLVGGPGLGIYEVDARHWRSPVVRAQGALSSEFVRDLEMVPGEQLAVMGDGGIDIGSLVGGSWTRTQHFGGLGALAGAAVRHGRIAGSNLFYVTDDGGFGRLTFDESGRVTQSDILVMEGRARGLTRESLQRAAEDRSRQALWMAHRAAESSEKLSAALYQMNGHAMAGLPSEEAWPASSTLTLAADPYDESLSAWIGGDGLRQVKAGSDVGTAPDGPDTTRTATGRRLHVTQRGLESHRVEELALNEHAVFAHATTDADNPALSAHTVQAATRGQIEQLGSAAWQMPYIGPRRFPDLDLIDLTAACESEVEGQRAIYFGTRDKGIGVFLRQSRELFLAHHSQHLELGRRIPFDGTLDLSARAGGQLFQIGSNRTLAIFTSTNDGGQWRTLIPASGIDIAPEDVRTVVARGQDVVIGSANRIGHYRADTHAWQSIPPIADLDRLLIAIDSLWAIDRNKKLYSYPLLAQGNAGWSPEEEDTIDVYGDTEIVAVIAGKKGVTRLWVQQKAGGREILATPKALPAPGAVWTAAAAAKGTLYVAPHAGAIGQYDLASHEWNQIPYPPGVNEAARQLLATTGGLWLLDGNNGLYFRPKRQDEWQAAGQNIQWISSYGTDVLTVSKTGSVQISTGGALPMATLVGDAFGDALNKVKAADVFQNNLFVGTADRVGRYETSRHHWQDYGPDTIKGVTQFAHTAQILYARAANDRVLRWTAADDTWSPILAGGQPLEAEQIVAQAGPMLFVRQAGGTVLAVSDERPDDTMPLITATQLGAGTITAAGEIGRDLFVGLNDGSVASYAKPAGKPSSWSQVLPPKLNAEAVRQVLIPPGDTNHVVVVSGQVDLLNRATDADPWTVSQLDQIRGPKIRGAVSKTDFYGFVPQADSDAQLWQATLNGANAPSLLIGPRFPESEQPTTAAVGVSPTRDLFRTDESGKTAQYDFATHGWKPHNIAGVRRFFRTGERLWAWAPSEATLYQSSQGDWMAADGDTGIRHVVGDNDAIMLVTERGAVVLRSGQAAKDDTIIPGLEKDLPIKGTESIVAVAESGNALFVAVKDEPLLAYDRIAHAWQLVSDVNSVSEFASVGRAGGNGVLFARSQDGRIFRFDSAAKNWSAVSIPNNAVAASIVAAENFAAVRTVDGDVLVIDAAGEVRSSFRAKMLAGRKAAELRPFAAAEFNGKLLLVPESKRDEYELWVYDPAAHSWHVEQFQGKPRHFLRADDALWLLTELGDERVSLYPITGDTPTLQTPIGELRDAVSDGKSLWVVTSKYAFQRLTAQGKFEATGIAKAALPDGRTVHRATSVAGDCVVLLDDGSVHHYSVDGREWTQQIPALEREDANPGRFVTGEQGRLLQLVRPNGELWICDTAAAKWTQLREGDDVTLQPEKSKTSWKVTGTAPNYTYAVEVGGRDQRLQLEEGRFDWDRVKAVTIDGDSLWLKTAAGSTRKYQRKAEKWSEVLENVGEFPEPKPVPLSVDGKVFSVRREPKGDFPAGNSALQITMKLGAESAILRPGENAAGAGFAHDVVRDIAVLDRDLWFATPGGAVRVTGLPEKLQFAQVVGAAQNLSDPNLAGLTVQDGSLFGRSATGKYFVRQAKQDKWRDATASNGDKAFAAGRSIERYNALLVNWRVHATAGAVQVLFHSAKSADMPVTLSARGFGFDQPQALSLTRDRIRLYTPDGLLELDRAKLTGSIDSISVAHKLPALTGYADVLEDPKGKETWLRSVAPPAKAWRFDGTAWQPAQLGEYDRTLATRQPNLWDRDGIQWSRDDQVKFATIAGLQQGTPFDAAAGRFRLDIPYDIAVYRDKLWVLTAGGVVRYDQTGQWSDVGLTSAAIGPNSRVIALPRDLPLVVQDAAELYEWNETLWRSAGNAERLRDAIKRFEAYLLDGDTWQLDRARVQGKPRTMRVKLLPGRDFVDVSLNDAGVFDFEQVNSVLDDGEAFHGATTFGLVRFDATKMDFTDLWPQREAAVRIGRLDKDAYAALKSGQVLKNSVNGWRPDNTRDVFPIIDSRLVQTAPWLWTQEGATLRVQLHKEAGGIWPEETPLSVGLTGGRFDFDTVQDVGLADRPWLATSGGLLARHGQGWVGISRAGPFKLQAGVGERVLFSVVPDSDPVLFARSAQGLLELTRDKWGPATDAKSIETLRTTQETRSSSFDVQRPAGRKLEVRLHAADDPPRLYKQVVFDPQEGLFTFDYLNHLTRQTGNKPAVLVATRGGVAKYIPGEPTEERMRRVFCDLQQDGIALVNVDGILLTKRDKINLLASRDSAAARFYRFDGEKWQEGKPQERIEDIYKREEMIIADEPTGWQIQDLATGQRQAGDQHFDIRWRGQRTRLANLQRTGDSSAGSVRFAHDIPLSVENVAEGIWLATRGGLVYFPLREKSEGKKTFDLSDFDLHSEQVLTAQELQGAAPPRGIVLIKRSKTEPQRVYARRADQSVLHYDPTKPEKAWSTVSEDNAEFRAACVVAADSLWNWRKDSIEPVRLLFNSDHCDLPESYASLRNGTWSFLETAHTARRDPRHTMVFYRSHLYVATSGGVSRFPAPQGPESVWAGRPGDFIDAVFAVAQATGRQVPLLDVTELYHDIDQDLLYARSAKGDRFIFNPTRDSWTLDTSSSDPMKNAYMVVRNNLFQWTMHEKGFTLDVLPLRAEMSDQSQYPLFHDGRFAFDDVRAFAVSQNQLWLATAGAACVYDENRFAPQRFFVRSLIPAPSELPQLREIVRDPADPARILCRNAADGAFELQTNAWQNSTDSETFLRAYTRDEDPLLRWVQFPDGALEAHLKDQAQANVFLGTKRGKTSLPLFSNNRFSFDDVQSAALDGTMVWAATPAGVVEHRLNWQREEAPITRLHCLAANSNAAPAEMSRLKRITQFPDGTLLAWGDGLVFQATAPKHANNPNVQWAVYPGVEAQTMTEHMRLPDWGATCELRLDEKTKDRMWVIRTGGLRGGSPKPVSAAFRTSDVSIAVMDNRWIYVPLPKGGVLRIPTSAVK